MTERIDIEIEQSPLEFVIEQQSQINDCVIEIKSDFGGLSVVHHTGEFIGEGSTNHPLSLSDEIKEAIVSVENKVDKTDIPSQFYGTDADGNQTTYDIAVLGDVEDVLVDGESVVEDRIARIDLTGKVDKVNEADKLYGTDSNGYQTTYNTADVLDKTFSYEQALASSVWNIQHNLNKYPSVTIVDSAGSVIEGKVNYININNIEIEFNSPFKGKAYLN